MENIVINTELYKKSAGGHEESHKCLLFTYDAIALMNENINRTYVFLYCIYMKQRIFKIIYFKNICEIEMCKIFFHNIPIV